MKQQDFSNHARFVKGFHGLTFLLLLAILVLAIINLVHVMGEPFWVVSGMLPLLTAIVLILIAFYARAFALKAQDRAIRAEENLRHFILTGKPLPAALKMGQIIAIRFAPDEELVQLAALAAKDNMAPVDIKKTIVNWRADHNRA